MFVFLLIALIFIFFSLVSSFFSFLLAAVLPPAFLQWCSQPWSHGVHSIWRADSILEACLPSKFSHVLRALHVTAVITGSSSLIISIGKSLMLQKEFRKKREFKCCWCDFLPISLCACVHLWHMYAFLCVYVWYIHCCSYCYKMLFQMEHLLITTLNLILYTVNSLYTPCLHTTADCTFILRWHMK